GPLPIHEATDYAVQAAQGLGYAHRQSIVHRDLKPSNLLLAPNGVVKLLDLGLAKVRAQSMRSNLSLQGMCQGTPEYMAPEQAETYSEADARSDLYSLGSTLFHLLTGELPVKGGSYLHKLQNLLLQPPRPVLDARPDVPKELAAVVDWLRSRDPQLRPASAEEAIALLEPFARRPPQEDPGAWDGQRKVALILEVFQGRITLEEVSQRYGLPLEELDRWRARFLEAAEQEFDPSGCSASAMSQQLRDMHTKIGSQAMEIEALKERLATLTPPA